MTKATFYLNIDCNIFGWSWTSGILGHTFWGKQFASVNVVILESEIEQRVRNLRGKGAGRQGEPKLVLGAVYRSANFKICLQWSAEPPSLYSPQWVPPAPTAVAKQKAALQTGFCRMLQHVIHCGSVWKSRPNIRKVRYGQRTAKPSFSLVQPLTESAEKCKSFVYLSVQTDDGRFVCIWRLWGRVLCSVSGHLYTQSSSN